MHSKIKSNSRSANHGIKGYIYQFIKTIDLILQLTNQSKITVEGHEDIDINSINKSTLIQCKYHEAQRFSPSRVYKPIGEMIKHFLNSQSKTKYWLYAHFGKNPPKDADWITIGFLRKALSAISSTISVQDKQLTDFLRQFEFIHGDKFEIIESKVKTSLRDALSCSNNDVEYYYYNNAINYIAELSTQNDINRRSINKKDFLNKINQKRLLFDAWLKEIKGKNEYIKLIRNQLETGKALSEIKNRYIFISKELFLKNNSENQLKNFLLNLTSEYPLIGELYNSKPWTVIVGVDKQQLYNIKKYLIENNIYYNDGYEDISFSSDYFNKMPVINSEKNNKINNASYTLRLISEATFKKQLTEISSQKCKPNTFINVSPSLKSNQIFVDDESILTYTISALDNISDLSTILKR
jgi:hypothetical protein